MMTEEDYWRYTVPTEKLRAMCEAERQRGLGAHWAYDLARHAAMLRVYKQRLASEMSAAKPVESVPR